MHLLPVLILLPGVLSGASALESVPTFEHQDRFTGITLNCAKCPPGTYMAARCTATTPTECAPCKEDHFTALWNYLPKCLYCNNFCSNNQEVETECLATGNRVCRCIEGYYWTGDFCVRHAKCGPGHGVKTKGTVQMNSVCEKCAEGYFSNSSSALDSCVNHQECATGQIVLLSGSAYHNTVCGTCEDMANGGETYRTFLFGFFPTRIVRTVKIKKFVARYIHKSGGQRRIRGTALAREKVPPLDHIRAWLTEAPKEELKKLPEMLRATRLCSLAEKLEKTLNEIEQQTSNCTSH